MDEIKLSLSIVLPGSMKLCREECPKTTPNSNHFQSMSYKTVYKPPTQQLNLGKTAFDYMTDRNSCPSWSKPQEWYTMSKQKRLESHLQRMVEHLGGISYTYQVFEG